MPHVLEVASTGRAKCRGCGGKIAAGELRFGERLPNPFAEDGGEMTHWFHMQCAAFRRPEAFLEAVRTSGSAEAPAPPPQIPDVERLISEAELGVAHRRLPRASTAECSPTGRATCRQCKALIEKNVWRIALVFYEEGRFAAAGFVHATCAAAYFETPHVLARVKHFSPELSEADLIELGSLILPES